MSFNNILAADLNYILENTAPLWKEFQNQQLFITGGTGFIGTWLLETFAWANKHFQLNLNVTVLTRSLTLFSQKSPHLVSDSTFDFLISDVRNFKFPNQNYNFIIHGATSSDAKTNEANMDLLADTILEGTEQTLKLAQECKTKKILFLSSGAVYGKQPSHISHIDEDFPPDPAAFSQNVAYSISKHKAEQLCLNRGKQLGLDIVIARGFTFVGPYLPLDTHFAIGNFIRDGLLENEILIKGDGTPYRSYLYAADLVIVLMHILIKGNAYEVYNVGCDYALSISNLATEVSKHFAVVPKIKILKTAHPNQPAERYVPSVAKSNSLLRSKSRIPLYDAIERTIRWYQSQFNKV